MDELTKKQQGFVRDYVATGNGTEAALNNYDIKSTNNPENVAAVIATENLSKPQIVDAIKSIAEQIPDSLLVEKHLALLNKKEKITKNNMTTGEIDVIDTGEIDAQAVKGGLDLAYKIKGVYNDDPNKNINILIPVLVKFLDKKDDKRDSNGDTN